MLGDVGYIDPLQSIETFAAIFGIALVYEVCCSTARASSSCAAAVPTRRSLAGSGRQRARRPERRR